MVGDNIILVLKFGKGYNFSDVQLLAEHFFHYKNTYCLLDKAQRKMDLLFCYVLPMPYIDWGSWWSKMNLFCPNIDYLRPFLYLDLDTAVMTPVENIFPKGRYRDGFIMLRDFRSKLPASGVMWFPKESDKVKRIWQEWIKNPAQHIKKYRGDQDFIGSILKPDYYWQDIMDGMVSFKPGGNWRKRLEGDEKTISFHGRPKIWEAAKSVEWVKNYVELND